jgi:hypothetical protein
MMGVPPQMMSLMTHERDERSRGVHRRLQCGDRACGLAGVSHVISTCGWLATRYRVDFAARFTVRREQTKDGGFALAASADLSIFSPEGD